MKRNKRKSDEIFNLDDIKAYMRMSAKDKLCWLERAVKFLHKITPAENKEIWEKLKERGF
ncbi:MAG: hypothetical protein HY096_04260 [Nitrospinae bacterium]|nr:hypothetical protein [Nitrospinota bacterium]